jgi:hypothetical protein
LGAGEEDRERAIVGKRSASAASELWRVIRQQKADIVVGTLGGLTGERWLKGTPVDPTPLSQ